MLFQYPKRATQKDQVWYDNKPSGVKKLAEMMKDLSKLASLICLKCSPIVLSGRLQSPCGHTLKLHRETSRRSRRRHRNEASLRNHNARPSSGQLKACSNVHSAELNGRPEKSQHQSLTDAFASSSRLLMDPSLTVVHSRNTAQQFVKYQPQALSSLFSNCQVNNVQVFMAQNSAEFH